jgi:hypothetical protein
MGRVDRASGVPPKAALSLHRRDHPYRSGLSKVWVKIKNPSAPGVLRFKVEPWAMITHRLFKAARGKHVGRRIDKPAEDEVRAFHAVPELRRAPVDMRDLGQVATARSPPPNQAATSI